MKNNKQKILIIASTFPRWANDTDPPFVLDLCKRLISTYTPFVLCPNAPLCKNDEIIDGIRVKRFRYFFRKLELLAYGTGILNKLKKNKCYYFLVPLFLLGELLGIIRQISKENFTIINPHWLIPQGFAAVIAGMVTGKRINIVCTLHGGDVFSLKNPFFTFIKKFTIKRLRSIVVVSHAMKETVLSMGADEENVHVIPMGVDLYNRFIPVDVEKKKRSILFVGRLVEKKGLKYLIDAFNHVQKKYPGTKLTIVGKGPEETSIRQQIIKYGIESCVELKGAVIHDELPGIYQSNELAVFPFIKDSSGDMEGFGLVMVEAMGCGCSVIASDLPAVHDIIIDNKTGLMVKQKDSKDLVNKISFLFDNRESLEKLSLQGRKYVEDRFDWKATEKKYCDLFNGIIEGKPASGNNWNLLFFFIPAVLFVRIACYFPDLIVWRS